LGLAASRDADTFDGRAWAARSTDSLGSCRTNAETNVMARASAPQQAGRGNDMRNDMGNDMGDNDKGCAENAERRQRSACGTGTISQWQALPSLTKADSGAEETQRNHQATIRLLSGYLRLPGPPSGGDMRDAAEPTTTALPAFSQPHESTLHHISVINHALLDSYEVTERRYTPGLLGLLYLLMPCCGKRAKTRSTAQVVASSIPSRLTYAHSS
jgi:hypothetical protein